MGVPIPDFRGKFTRKRDAITVAPPTADLCTLLATLTTARTVADRMARVAAAAESTPTQEETVP